MDKELITITEKILNSNRIEKAEAYFLTSLVGSNVYKLFSYANSIREYFKGNFIDLCAIINAKSGACPEDCSYCSQSAHYDTKVDVYPLISKDKIIERAKSAKKNGARRFCIVTSGRRIENNEEIMTIAEYVSEIKELGLLPCATLGMLGEEELGLLKEAGLNSLSP